MMRTPLVCLLLAAAACGDNAAAPPDAADSPRVDAAVDPRAARSVIVSGDFAAAGVLSTIDLPGLRVRPNRVDGVAGTDPFLRQIDDRIYIVNRLGGDNVTILDARTLELIDQISTGAGSNPQDVAVVGNKLYLPALATAGVVVIDRGAGNARTTIAIDGIDPDDVPDCVSAYAVDTRVFVACGVLDGTFTPRGDGVVAVIDTATDTVTRTFDLPDPNPTGLFARTPATSLYGGDLVIGLVPDYQNFATGCLARVAVGPTPAANGCAATNSDLGGYANHVSVDPDGLLLWVAVDGFDASFHPFGKLRGIDFESGAIWEWSVSPDAQVIVDVAACPGGMVVVADRATGATGIRVYEGIEERTTTPLDIGMPPAFGNNIVCYRP